MLKFLAGSDTPEKKLSILNDKSSQLSADHQTLAGQLDTLESEYRTVSVDAALGDKSANAQVDKLVADIADTKRKLEAVEAAQGLVEKEITNADFESKRKARLSDLANDIAAAKATVKELDRDIKELESVMPILDRHDNVFPSNTGSNTGWLLEQLKERRAQANHLSQKTPEQIDGERAAEAVEVASRMKNPDFAYGGIAYARMDFAKLTSADHERVAEYNHNNQVQEVAHA